MQGVGALDLGADLLTRGLHSAGSTPISMTPTPCHIGAMSYPAIFT